MLIPNYNTSIIGFAEKKKNEKRIYEVSLLFKWCYDCLSRQSWILTQLSNCV